MTDEESIRILKERVKDGNQKLNEAWSRICQIPTNSEQWGNELERWHEANKKLSAMCYQLQSLGFHDCLYIENGVKTRSCLSEPIGCRVCPSARAYWEEEIMKLPSGGQKKPEEPKQGELSGI